MRGRWGIAWLAWNLWLAVSICLPGTGAAADAGWWRNADGRLPILAVSGSSLEAQMLGERNQPTSPYNKLKIFDGSPGLSADQEGGATLKLPKNLELKVSFLYNRDSSQVDPRRQQDAEALVKYSMDYRLLPNLKVGLSGYLYYPRADQGYSLGRPFGDRVLGLGPGVKYDLGQWSFVLKMQMEPGGARDRGDNVQNWLRVWYAF